jgi:mRNA interferase MazF
MNFSQWSVWLANLDPIVGSEQGRTRPVMVISDSSLNEILPVVNVIPITSRKPNRRIYPNEAVIPTTAGGRYRCSLNLTPKVLANSSPGFALKPWG